jgi:hypothetical protein
MIDFIISVLFTIASYKVTTFLTCLAIGVPIIFLYDKLPLVKNKKPVKNNKRIRAYLILFAVMLFLCGFVNMFFGTYFVGNLVYMAGDIGSAVTVSTKQTNNQYNHQWIYEHTVIIETKDGVKYEAAFDDSDFNIFPSPDDGYVYPSVGEKFSVKYLARNPKAFVIISDDDSPYAKKIRCGGLRQAFDEAKRKLKYDSLNTDYKEKYIKARDEYNNKGCGNYNK